MLITWKHCNKSCLLILINHKQWCTVNMFLQHYQRRGGFLLFLSLWENIVITPWRCKWAKLFGLSLFHYIWKRHNFFYFFLFVGGGGWRWKKKVLSIIHMLMCTPRKGCDISNSTRYDYVRGLLISCWKAFICVVNEKRVIQCMYVF